MYHLASKMLYINLIWVTINIIIRIAWNCSALEVNFFWSYKDKLITVILKGKKSLRLSAVNYKRSQKSNLFSKNTLTNSSKITLYNFH